MRIKGRDARTLGTAIPTARQACCAALNTTFAGGDGVNIAARLEGICEPGGVLISSTAYDHVRGKIDAEFVDLGEKTGRLTFFPSALRRVSPDANTRWLSTAISPRPMP